MIAGSGVQQGKDLGAIGAGVMGRTLLRGLLDSGLMAKSQDYGARRKTEATCEKASAELGVPVEVEYEHRLKNTGMLLVCVKSAQSGKVLAHLRESGLPKDTFDGVDHGGADECSARRFTGDGESVDLSDAEYSDALCARG